MSVQVFISYSREDKRVVDALRKDLKQAGFGVFLDDELTGGQEWWDRLLGEIRSSDVFIPAISEEWLGSTACARETDYAFELDRHVLPVLLDGVVTKLLPSRIARTQAVPYDPEDKDATLAVVRAVISMPESPALPETLPLPPEVPISYLSALRDKVTAEQELSRTEQELILAEFLRRQDEEDDRPELLVLLRRFGRREDLNVGVAKAIDRMIEALETSTDRGPSTADLVDDETASHDSADLVDDETASHDSADLLPDPVWRATYGGSPFDIYKAVLTKKYADFSGRARRAEYWWFTLLNTAVLLLFSSIGAVDPGGAIGVLAQVALIGYLLVVAVPWVAVAVRRLHDTNRTGWMLLISLIPIIGSFILLVFYLTDGDTASNDYGPSPKYASG